MCEALDHRSAAGTRQAGRRRGRYEGKVSPAGDSSGGDIIMIYNEEQALLAHTMQHRWGHLFDLLNMEVNMLQNVRACRL